MNIQKPPPQKRYLDCLRERVQAMEERIVEENLNEIDARDNAPDAIMNEESDNEEDKEGDEDYMGDDADLGFNALRLLIDAASDDFEMNEE